MGILLRDEKFWPVATWVSRLFFDDCLEVIDHDSSYNDIKSDIEFTIQANVFTLDYREADRKKIKEFNNLVLKVIELNEKRKGENFNDKSAFPVYMEKLYILRKTLDEVTQDL